MNGGGELDWDSDSKIISSVEFKRHKKYYRANIPLEKILEASGLEVGAKARIELYIEDIGVVSKNWRLNSRYLELHLPSRYSESVDLKRRYRVYLLKAVETDEILERNVIVYGGGRKARVEIPRWYLDKHEIPYKQVILKVDTEIEGSRKTLYTRYKGYGPAIQSIPPMNRYPRKINILNISVYNLEDFIRDFNQLARQYKEYENIKLELDDKLYLVIDGERIEAREYLYSTYAYYTYLLLRIHGRNNFKTLRIHNYGDAIKIYYIQHTKKHKLTDHAAYMPLKRIAYGAGKILIIYFNPRRNKLSKTYLVMNNLPVSNLQFIAKIKKKVNLSSSLICYVIELKKEKWLEKSTILNNKRRYYYMGIRSTGYTYELGGLGEQIAYELLRLEGYKIKRKNEYPWDDGPDMILTNKEAEWIVEVKAISNEKRLYQKLNESLSQWRDRLKEKVSTGIKIGILSVAVYISDVEPECKVILRSVPL